MVTLSVQCCSLRFFRQHRTPVNVADLFPRPQRQTRAIRLLLRCAHRSELPAGHCHISTVAVLLSESERVRCVRHVAARLRLSRLCKSMNARLSFGSVASSRTAHGVSSRARSHRCRRVCMENVSDPPVTSRGTRRSIGYLATRQSHRDRRANASFSFSLCVA